MCFAYRVRLSIRALIGAAALLIHGSMAGQHDIDGDGFIDQIESQRGYDPLVPRTGLVEIRSGADNSLLFSAAGTVLNDGFGYAATFGPDVTGDGSPEILISTPHADTPSGTPVSRIDLYDAFTGQIARSHVTPDSILSGLAAATVGDLNADGIQEYAIESLTASDDGHAATSTTIYSGLDGTILATYRASVYAMQRRIVSNQPLWLDGDVDRDGRVSDSDLDAVLAAFGQTPADATVDFNSDGVIDDADLQVVTASYGTSVFQGRAREGAMVAGCSQFSSHPACAPFATSEVPCVIELQANNACNSLEGVPLFSNSGEWRGNQVSLRAVPTRNGVPLSSSVDITWEVSYRPPGSFPITRQGRGSLIEVVSGPGTVGVHVTSCSTTEIWILTVAPPPDGVSLCEPVCDASSLQSAGSLVCDDCVALQTTNPYDIDLSIDSDGDSLPDLIELCYFGTSPYRFDSDSDGLDDYLEVQSGTDPTLLSTDGQEDDGQRAIYTGSDLDGDGISDLLERARGWDPTNPDQDRDGVIDGDEIRYAHDPSSPRSLLRTNPDPTDSDQDGLRDHLEQIVGTDPYDFDTDGDALPDGFEVEHRFSLELLPTSRDSDGDDIPDGEEDADGDGLTNFEEYFYGIDPASADTDGDGTPDGDEINNGTDPVFGDDFNDPHEVIRAPVGVVVGDHSGSASESWSLVVGTERVSAGIGEVRSDTVVLPRGRTHPIRLYHDGTRLSSPDYDYVANVAGQQTPYYVTDDPDDLLGTHNDDSTWSDETATITLPYDCGQLVSISGPDAIGVYDTGDSTQPAGELFSLDVPSYISGPISVEWSVIGNDLVVTPTATASSAWVGPRSVAAGPQRFTVRATATFPGFENCGRGTEELEVVQETFEKDVWLVRVNLLRDPETHHAGDSSSDLFILPSHREDVLFTVEPSGYNGLVRLSSSVPANVGFQEILGFTPLPWADVLQAGGQNVSRTKIAALQSTGDAAIIASMPGTTGAASAPINVRIGGRIEVVTDGLPTVPVAHDGETDWVAPSLPAALGPDEPPTADAPGPVLASEPTQGVRSIEQGHYASVQPMGQEATTHANATDGEPFQRFMRVSIVVYDGRDGANAFPKPGVGVYVSSRDGKVTTQSSGGARPELLLEPTWEMFLTNPDGEASLDVYGNENAIESDGLPGHAFSTSYDWFAIGVGDSFQFRLAQNPDTFGASDMLRSVSADRVVLKGYSVEFYRTLLDEDEAQSTQLTGWVLPVLNEAQLDRAIASISADALLASSPLERWEHPTSTAGLILNIYNPDLGIEEPRDLGSLIDEAEERRRIIEEQEIAIGRVNAIAAMASLATETVRTFAAQSLGGTPSPVGTTIVGVVDGCQYEIEVLADWTQDEIDFFRDRHPIIHGNILVAWNLAPLAPDVLDITRELIIKPYLLGQDPDYVTATIAVIFLTVDITPGTGNAISLAKPFVLKVARSELLERVLRAVGQDSFEGFMRYLEHAAGRVPIPSGTPTLADAQRILEPLLSEVEAISKAPLLSGLSTAAKDNLAVKYFRVVANDVVKITGEFSAKASEGIVTMVHVSGGQAAKLNAMATNVFNQAISSTTVVQGRRLATKSLDSMGSFASHHWRQLRDLPQTGPIWDYHKRQFDEAVEAASRPLDQITPPQLRDDIIAMHVGDGKAFATFQEFEFALRMRTDTLADIAPDQLAAIRAIRDSIQAPAVGDKLSKVVSLDALPSGATPFTTLGGFFARAADSTGANSGAKALSDRHALDFNGGGLRDGDSYMFIETDMTADIALQTNVPRHPQVGGFREEPPITDPNAINPLTNAPYDQYPFTGKGLSASKDGHLAPEWALTSPVQMRRGQRPDGTWHTTVKFRDGNGQPIIRDIEGVQASDWALDANGDWIPLP